MTSKITFQIVSHFNKDDCENKIFVRTLIQNEQMGEATAMLRNLRARSFYLIYPHRNLAMNRIPERLKNM